MKYLAIFIAAVATFGLAAPAEAQLFKEVVTDETQAQAWAERGIVTADGTVLLNPVARIAYRDARQSNLIESLPADYQTQAAFIALFMKVNGWEGRTTLPGTTFAEQARAGNIRMPTAADVPAPAVVAPVPQPAPVVAAPVAPAAVAEVAAEQAVVQVQRTQAVARRNAAVVQQRAQVRSGDREGALRTAQLIAGMNGKIANFDSRLTALASRLTEVEGQVTGLRTDVDANGEAIAANATADAALADRVGALENAPATTVSVPAQSWAEWLLIYVGVPLALILILGLMLGRRTVSGIRSVNWSRLKPWGRKSDDNVLPLNARDELPGETIDDMPLDKAA